MRSVTAVLAVLAVAAPAARAELGLSDSDRVMFVSSTPLWPPSPGIRVETFVRVKYPALRTRFWHVAPRVGGSIEQAKQHIDEHLGAFRPTLVVLNFGLAHGQSQSLRVSRLASFRADLQELIERCEKAGARVMLVTPNYPEAARKTRLARSKYDETVAGYAEAVRKIGAQRQLAVVDWFAAAAEQAAKSGGDFTPGRALTLDGLVPSPLASAIGAELFLQAIGAEPLLVEVDVDWGTLEAGTTAGSISASRRGEATVAVELHGLPIPWLVPGRGRQVQLSRAGSPMCRFVLRLGNVPPGGVLISKPGGRATPFAQQAVDGGIDLASIGAVGMSSAASDLMERIKRKDKTVDGFQRFLSKPLAEPEYAEANRKYLEAILAEVDGTSRIIDRTPRAIDLTLEIKLAGAKGG